MTLKKKNPTQLFQLLIMLFPYQSINDRERGAFLEAQIFPSLSMNSSVLVSGWSE